MFEALPQLPGDPLLGLMHAFTNDPNSDKIDLGVGVYKDEQGLTPILEAVKRAEAQLLDTQTSKAYIGSAGAPAFCGAIEALLFPCCYTGGQAMLKSGQVSTVQTPGGTGALRVAADFIHRNFPAARIWVSTPTWANHFNVFESAGLGVEQYPYYRAQTQDLDVDAMLTALSDIPRGDVVLLHGCCHNPTGLDLDSEQWHQVGEIFSSRGLLPFFDCAYLGFAEGLEEDVRGINILAGYCPEMLIATSCSKNLGLYNERIGALTLVTAAPRDAEAAFSQLNDCIRGNYSMPPNHGAAVVSTILNDPELRTLWQHELAEMRQRIQRMRLQFVDTLKRYDAPRDFSFIGRQRGMFSFSGLTPAQVRRLREEDSIYIVDSGRINLTGINTGNIERLCQAIARVIA